MSVDLFKPAKLKRRIILKPYELNKNYEQKIINNVIKNYDGKCVARVGYIKKGSIQIESKSIGKLDSSDFTGNIRYDVIFRCEITIPCTDTILYGQVIQKNKIGLTAKPVSIQAYVEELPYVLLIPKEIHTIEENDLIDSYNIGDDITVKIETASFIPEKIGKKAAHYLVLCHLQPKAQIIDRFYTIPDLEGELNNLLYSFNNRIAIAEQNAKWIKDVSIYNRLRSLKDEIDKLKVAANNITLPYININKWKRKHKGHKDDNDNNDNNIWRDLIRSIINPYELISPSSTYNSIHDEKTKKFTVRSIIEWPSGEQIISRAFYKLYEILHKFPELISNKNGITCLSIGESPGGFIQALIKYRKNNSKTDDVYIGISKTDYDNSKEKKETTWMSRNKKTEEYLKIYDDLDIVHYIPDTELTLDKNSVHLIGGTIERKPKTEVDRSNDRIGNIFYEDTLNLIKEIKADFITADGGQTIGVDSDEEQPKSDVAITDSASLKYEQEITHYQLIYAEIYYALNCQNINGSFILKIFDIITDTTVHFIAILKHYYNSVSLYKPYTSRPANSEKYVICKGFKGITDVELNTYRELFLKFYTVDENQYLSQVLILPDTAEIINTIKEFNNTFMKLEADNIELGIQFGKNYLTLAKEWSDSTTVSEKKLVNDKFHELQLREKRAQTNSEAIQRYVKNNHLSFKVLSENELKLFDFVSRED